MRNKFNCVHGFVQWVALAVGPPVYFARGCCQFSKVPDLEPLTPRASPRDNGVQIPVHVNRVATCLRATDLVRDLLSPHVPKLDRRVPATRIKLIPALRVELHTENLVLVRLHFPAPTDDLHELHRLIIVDLDLGQEASKREPFAVVRVVSALVLVLYV